MAKHKSDILDVIHGTISDFHKVGAVDDQTMRQFDALCLPKIKKFTPRQIAQIRKKNKASQAVFAIYLNTSKSTVQKWEQGVKRPSNIALKLLNMVDRNGLSSLAA